MNNNLSNRTGGATAGRSIRMGIGGGFAVGDLIGMNDTGEYIKINTSQGGVVNAARTIGLMVNDSELLLYGLTESTDAFDPETHVGNYDSDSTETLYFASYGSGTLTARDGQTPNVPLALRLGSSSQIFFFNTRPGQG